MKKYVIMLFTVLVFICSVSIMSAFADSFAAGDVNCDGDVNIKDATLIQRYAVSLVEFSDKEMKLADVNADGDVNIKDATMVQKYIAGLFDKFPSDELPQETVATENPEAGTTPAASEPAEESTTAPEDIIPSTPVVTAPSVDEDGYFNEIVRP